MRRKTVVGRPRESGGNMQWISCHITSADGEARPVKRRALPSVVNGPVEAGQQITPRMKTMVLARKADSGVEEVIAVAGAQDELQKAALVKLNHQILPTGEAIADIGGELDIATAETAVKYVRQIIDRHHGPVIVNLASLRFCDARGLSALLRMSSYAEQADCPFRLASPRPSLIKLMRITGLDRRLLAP
jgi:anti-sigma B factor antagonist